MLWNLLITALVGLALEPQAFLNDYTLVNGSNDCVNTITIEKRTDWQDQEFIGLNENQIGRGLQCTFYSINEAAQVERDNCVSAGPTIPGCRFVTKTFSTLSGNTLLSERTKTTYVWAAVTSKRVTTCELTLNGTELTYKKSDKKTSGFATSNNSRTCVYQAN